LGDPENIPCPKVPWSDLRNADTNPESLGKTALKVQTQRDVQEKRKRRRHGRSHLL
jgi:hypothetical protein